MDNPESLVLDRRHLSLGKYTRWAANLSDEEMYGLLWFLGEFGIRSSEYNLHEEIQQPGRARTGLLGALGFVHGRPLTQEKAMRAMRNAYKDSSQNQSLDCGEE
jgi:hypothetical protein